MDAAKLKQILDAHALWLRGEGGARADLRECDLRGCDLRWASLHRADLSWCNLSWADLRGADLRGADLYGADLRECDLRGCDLRWASLRWADLRGAKIDPGPTVENLDARILDIIKNAPEALQMESWHSECGTAHCLAGWAVTLAGEEGKALESEVGTAAAGMRIFLSSTGSTPNFYGSNEAALAELRERVKEAS